MIQRQSPVGSSIRAEYTQKKTRLRPGGLHQKCANGRYVFWRNLHSFSASFLQMELLSTFAPKWRRKTSISRRTAFLFALRSARAAFFFKLASRDKLNDSKLTFSLSRARAGQKGVISKLQQSGRFPASRDARVLANRVFDLTTKIAAGFLIRL